MWDVGINKFICLEQAAIIKIGETCIPRVTSSGSAIQGRHRADGIVRSILARLGLILDTLRIAPHFTKPGQSWIMVPKPLSGA